jgi:hypothetical protein
MDIIAAYREAGTYRGAASIAGTTHKTVKRVIGRHEAARLPPLQDGELVAQDQDFGGLPRLTPGQPQPLG